MACPTRNMTLDASACGGLCCASASDRISNEEAATPRTAGAPAGDLERGDCQLQRRGNPCRVRGPEDQAGDEGVIGLSWAEVAALPLPVLGVAGAPRPVSANG